MLHHGASMDCARATSWLTTRAGITYTFPEAESAKTRDSVTCTLLIFWKKRISKNNNEQKYMTKEHALFHAASTREFPQTHDHHLPGQRTRHPIGTRLRARQHRQHVSHVLPSRAAPRPGGKTWPQAYVFAWHPMHRGRLCVSFMIGRQNTRGMQG